MAAAQVSALPIDKKGFNRGTFIIKLTPRQFSDMLEYWYFYELSEAHFYRDFFERKNMGDNSE
jgi:hypothetical protein